MYSGNKKLGIVLGSPDMEPLLSLSNIIENNINKIATSGTKSIKRNEEPNILLELSTAQIAEAVWPNDCEYFDPTIISNESTINLQNTTELGGNDLSLITSGAVGYNIIQTILNAPINSSQIIKDSFFNNKEYGFRIQEKIVTGNTTYVAGNITLPISIIFSRAGTGNNCYESFISPDDVCLDGSAVNGIYNISGYDNFNFPVYTGGSGNSFKFYYGYEQGQEGPNLEFNFTNSYWRLSQFKNIPDTLPWLWDGYLLHYSWTIGEYSSEFIPPPIIADFFDTRFINNSSVNNKEFLINTAYPFGTPPIQAIFISAQFSFPGPIVSSPTSERLTFTPEVIGSFILESSGQNQELLISIFDGENSELYKINSFMNEQSTTSGMINMIHVCGRGI